LTPEGCRSVRLYATAVFLQGTTLVRILQYEGEADQLARAWADDRGLARERELAPYLSVPREVRTADDLVVSFHAPRMRCFSRLPVAPLLARPCPWRKRGQPAAAPAASAYAGLTPLR